MQSIAELLPYTLLALTLVGVGFLYTRCFQQTHRLFAKLPGPRMIRPAIGAALAGFVAIAFYYSQAGDTDTLAVLSTGYGLLQTALKSPQDISIGILLTVAALKIITTSLTISSGGSGGVFGPSMVIGGCIGHMKFMRERLALSEWPASLPGVHTLPFRPSSWFRK
jgi:CIC family chloride channel protein